MPPTHDPDEHDSDDDLLQYDEDIDNVQPTGPGSPPRNYPGTPVPLVRPFPTVVDDHPWRPPGTDPWDYPEGWNEYPKEIPDSQEDPADQDLSDLGPNPDLRTSNYKSVATKIIPGGTKPTVKQEPDYTLHKEGINCNGRLAHEDPALADYLEMEDQATQEATQPYLDPRRTSEPSMLNEQDESDVLCILHPASPSAFKAVEIIAASTPQHILQNQGLSHILENIDDDGKIGDGIKAGLPENGVQDIALRLSSRVNDPCMGFTFGRNPKEADLLICLDEEKKKSSISSAHFRIYVNQAGVIMCEDTSMNGTWVDNTAIMLKPNPTDLDVGVRRMIGAGSIISIQELGDKEGMRFIIALPRRENAGGNWGRKLGEYLAFVEQEERKKAAATEAACGRNMFMPALLNLRGNGAPQATLPSAHAARTLAAGSELYQHGMHWSGGDVYNVVGYIGKGAFALVYKLATKKDGELYAAKQLEKRRYMKDGVLDQKIHNELQIMKNLRHPNIVKYIDHKEIPSYLYIIMEYVPYGDLMTYINTGQVMPEYLCKQVARQICQALDYLHRQNVTHRDIKPDNILVASNEPFVVKLSDFGLSKVVTGDDTFLKTFCGTLLYCAPEVYPGYDRYNLGLPRKRRRDEPPPKTLPYKQSVDVWAFAAVLYHLLCAKPPFTGSTEYRGAIMLETIMSTPVDYDRLKYAGVSALAIDFLQNMLVLAPNLRATEQECLIHPWISHIADIQGLEDVNMETTTGGLRAIAENEEDELDASQLSLADRPIERDVEDSDDDSFIDVDEVKQSKRFKVGGELATREEQAMTSSGVSYPFHPGMQGGQPYTEGHRPSGANRLFGEIGVSALRSSGVLGYDAHAALEMQDEGSRDASASPSRIHYTNDFGNTNDGIAPHNVQCIPSLRGGIFTASAPSLMGTEALVGQLNMASPDSGISTPKMQTRQTSPVSATAAGSKRSSQDMRSPVEENSPKRSKTSGLEAPAQVPKDTSSTHPKGASKASGTSKVGVHNTRSRTSRGKSLAASSLDKKKVDNGKNESTVEGSNAVAKILGATAHVKHASVQATAASNPGSFGHNKPTSASTITKDAPTNIPEFAKPLARLGNLLPTTDSIATTPIKLEKRVTTYGREPSSDYQHKDTMDVRIPKCAIDITFWRPGIESMITNKEDWTVAEDLYAIISTRTSLAIKVNGVRLTKGVGCWKFGKLHTGDIITVFEPLLDGQGNVVVSTASSAEKAAEYLRFKCEFLVGASKEPRPEGNVFTVEKEEEKFLQWQMNKSRETSASASVDDSGNGGKATKSASPPATKDKGKNTTTTPARR